MIYVVLKYDQYGRSRIVRSTENKAEIGKLESDEVVNTGADLEQIIAEVKQRNEFRKNQLLGKMNEVNIIPSYQAPVTFPSSVINPDKISDKGFELIKQFQENPSDLNLGALMAIHNEEKWSEHIFCCGSQKQQMENLLKTMNGLSVALG